jgi:hypothetical protein
MRHGGDRELAVAAQMDEDCDRLPVPLAALAAKIEVT